MSDFSPEFYLERYEREMYERRGATAQYGVQGSFWAMAMPVPEYTDLDRSLGIAEDPLWLASRAMDMEDSEEVFHERSQFTPFRGSMQTTPRRDGSPSDAWSMLTTAGSEPFTRSFLTTSVSSPLDIADKEERNPFIVEEMTSASNGGGDLESPLPSSPDERVFVLARYGGAALSPASDGAVALDVFLQEIDFFDTDTRRGILAIGSDNIGTQDQLSGSVYQEETGEEGEEPEDIIFEDLTMRIVQALKF